MKNQLYHHGIDVRHMTVKSTKNLNTVKDCVVCYAGVGNGCVMIVATTELAMIMMSVVKNMAILAQNASHFLVLFQSNVMNHMTAKLIYFYIRTTFVYT